MFDSFADEPDPLDDEEIGYFRFLALYLVSMAGMVGASYAGEVYFQWPMMRTGMALCAALFLAGALQRPRWTWYMLRRAGWFALLPAPLLRLLFVAVAGLCIFLAIEQPF